MRESKVEKLLREGVEAAGGMCEKFVSPGKRGVPDRIVTWPHSDNSLARPCVDFVETKAPDGRVKPHQARDHKRRRALGQRTFVLSTAVDVNWYLVIGRHLDMPSYQQYVNERHTLIFGHK